MICPKCGSYAEFLDEKILPAGILKSHHRCRNCDAVFVGIVNISRHPTEATRPRKVTAKAKTARNDLIRSRVAAGERQTDVAIAFGITKQRVGQIVRADR